MSCGPFGKWGDWAVWDRPFGLDMRVPCKRHDKRYENPEGKTKAEVDLLFYEEGLEEAAKSPWYLRAFHRKIAWAYYKGVSVGSLSWELCRIREAYETRMENMQASIKALEGALAVLGHGDYA